MQWNQIKPKQKHWDKKHKHNVKNFTISRFDFQFPTAYGKFKGRLDKKIDGLKAFLTKSEKVANLFNIETNYWYNIQKNTTLRDEVASHLVDAMVQLHTTDFNTIYRLHKGCGLIEIHWGDFHLHLFVPLKKPFSLALGGHCWKDNCSGVSVETNIEIVMQVLDLPTKYNELVQYILDRC
ncbi:MAG: hypothetical protein CL728_04475 [Chloroflexi bacterium]|nr:hypothetical protein [Chloroflexota bacterium]|tara:strand:- start:914 stop:1453 length:540 start_codon:yes stop_codon:yes gene_type:complete